MKIKRQKVNEVAEQLASIEGFSEVFSVTGSYDLISIVRVKDNNALSDLITNELKDVEGIEKTDTMLAFKAYSKHDLATMFDFD
jgi:DNA-binding Lrp family transcriptional regulator